MNIPILQSPRLNLLPLTIDDAPAVQRIFPQWEIVRFLSTNVPWPYPDDGAVVFLRDIILPRVAAGRAWAWSIRLKEEPDRLIGVINLQFGEKNRSFWLDPEWCRRGLMTEAASVVTVFWFETLDQKILRIPKAVPNLGSCRISEREGMHVIATSERDFVGGRFPCGVYEMTRDEWRARRAFTSR